MRHGPAEGEHQSSSGTFENNMNLEAAVLLGIVFPHIFSLRVLPPPPPDCLAVFTCMSDVCKKEEAFNSSICDDGACHIKGLQQCNMTIQSILEFLCLCVWEQEPCESMRVLNTQCRPNTAAHQKESTEMNWKSSTLIHSEYDEAGSCMDRMKTCVSDAVCNRYLVPVLQVCTAEPCDHNACQRLTQQFYSSMPLSVAEMLALCECEDSDLSCLHMKTTLHSGTCGDSTWVCQETVNQCAKDQTCRQLLKTFQEKCWSSEEAQCRNTDLEDDECFIRMDPALILSADPECKKAFLATLGTRLHHPCTCRGMHGEDLKMCNRIRDVFHDRSHFMMSWRNGSSRSGPSIPSEINKEYNLWSNDYLLYAFATLLLVGVVILMPLAVIIKTWMLRRDKTKFHHPQKSNCVVIL